MTTRIITLNITLDGKTRPVEFTEYNGQRKASSAYIFTARLGRTGSKTHRTHANIWSFDSVEAAKARGYRGREIITDEEGQVWGFQRNCTILNRAGGMIYGWVEDAESTSMHSREHKA